MKVMFEMIREKKISTSTLAVQFPRKKQPSSHEIEEQTLFAGG